MCPIILLGHAGNYADIGTNCSIHQGVTVGEGSLISMGSVVLHDVPSTRSW